jgi:hypothetical protein
MGNKVHVDCPRGKIAQRTQSSVQKTNSTTHGERLAVVLKPRGASTTPTRSFSKKKQREKQRNTAQLRTQAPYQATVNTIRARLLCTTQVQEQQQHTTGISCSTTMEIFCTLAFS